MTPAKRGAVYLGIAAAMFAAAFLSQGASAQQVRIYPWCLEESCGGRSGCQTLCRFDSYQQCMKSKTSGADRCVQNYYKQRP